MCSAEGQRAAEDRLRTQVVERERKMQINRFGANMSNLNAFCDGCCVLKTILKERRRSIGQITVRNSKTILNVAFLDDDAIAEPNWIEQLLVP